MGEGGHPEMEGREVRMSCLALSGLLQYSMRRRSRVATGEDEGHIRRIGIIGSTWLVIGERDRIRLNGMSGRLKKACHDQLDGSSVSNRSYILATKKSVLETSGYSWQDSLLPKKFL